jgi:hypothetical protein
MEMDAQTIISIRTNAISLAHEVCEIEGDTTTQAVLCRAIAYEVYLRTGQYVVIEAPAMRRREAH